MSYPNLNLLLHAANRRTLMVSVSRVILLALAYLLLSLLVAVSLDAVFALPVWALALADVLIVGLFGAGCATAFRVARKLRFDPRQEARRLEIQLGIRDNALINALDLRDAPRTGTSRELLQEAVQHGEAVARQADVRQAISVRPAARAAWICAGVTLLLLLVALLVPGLWRRGLPRLLDPAGDHPPFTRLKFAVQTQPEPLYAGSSATIAAVLAGPELPDRADLVFVDGATRERVPMSSEATGFRLRLEQVGETREFYIDTPAGRSDRYALSVSQVPLIQEAWVRYEFPAHTAWPPREQRLENRDVEGLLGTRVTISVVSNLPLASSSITLRENPQAKSTLANIPLQPTADDPRRATGSFVLDRSGWLSLQLQGANQVPSRERLEARVRVQADRAPQVSIPDPEPWVYAVEGWKVPVKITADDDVRIEQLELNHARPGQTLIRVPLENQSADPRRARAEIELDLAQLGAQVGEEILFFASAADNAPGGAQSADSPTHRIKVISQDEYLEFLRAEYQMEELQTEIAELTEQLQAVDASRTAALEELSELQEQLTSEQPLQDDARAQIKDLQAKLDKFQDQAAALTEQLQDRSARPQLYDVEQSYRQQLDELSDKLAAQSATAQELNDALQSLSEQGSSPAADRERLKSLAEQLQAQPSALSDGTRQSLEQQQALARKLSQSQRMLSEANRIQQITQQQRDLADRMQSLADAAGDPQAEPPATAQSPQNSTPPTPTPPSPTLPSPTLPSPAPSTPAPSTPTPPTPTPPTPSTESLRRANRLAHEQERLQQQLQEAVESLAQAAAEAQHDLPRTARDAQAICNSIGEQQVTGDQRRSASSARAGQGQAAQQASDEAARKLESLAGQAPSSSGAASEASAGLDQGLSMSGEQVAQSLQQLLSGAPRSPAGGANSMSGAPPELSPGSPQGRGSGAPAQFGLHGPRPPRQAFQSRRRGRANPEASGEGTAELGDAEALSAEVVEADSVRAQQGRTGQLRGVPLEYREQAEAYFRRLAEEQAAEQD